MDDGSSLKTGLDDAFSVLADETRLAILQALWEGDEPSVQFSTLRKSVGMRDSGNFSYHLEKLVPRFVREVEDEYDLTYAGKRVIGAALAGTYTEASTTDVGPIRIDTECSHCGGTLEGQYDSGTFSFTCLDCGRLNERLGVPPVVVSGHGNDDLRATLGRYVFTRVQKRASGFCLLCTGQMDVRLSAFEDATRILPDEYTEVIHICQECGLQTRAGIESVLLDHPALVSFLWEHDIDLRERTLYERNDLLPFDSDIESEDPVRVSVTVEADGDTLELTLDESLEVIENSLG